MSVISIKQLLEAGVQFGHPTRQWNPKMSKYIFVARNDTHIIDLEKTVVLVEEAYNYVKKMAEQGKTVLFVGTKKQASEAIQQEAERCGMYYVNTRWLGGTLTNFKTIRNRVDRLNKLNQMEKTGEFEFFPKKEVIKLRAEKDKLQRNLGGIKDMTDLPGLLFVVDLKKEHIAVKEARALGIPVVALVDTNCDPELVDVVIPGNDDAIRSVKLIASTVADAILEAKNGVSLQQAEEVASVEEPAEKVTKKVFKEPTATEQNAEETQKDETAEEKVEPVKEEAKKKTTKKVATKETSKKEAESEPDKKVTVKKTVAKSTAKTTKTEKEPKADKKEEK